MEGEDNKPFIKGFNQGYLLQQYEPETTKSLVSGIQSEGEYETGFKAGSKEFLKEREQQRLKDLQNLKNKGQERDRSI